MAHAVAGGTVNHPVQRPAQAAYDDPVFDPTGINGPTGWEDLYRMFKRWRRTTAAHVQAVCDPEHVCNAMKCAIFSRGDFYVCAATEQVHYCPNVYTCEHRRNDDGYVICSISGVAKADDELTPFGNPGFEYADDDGGAPNQRKRKRAHDGVQGRSALYARARYCSIDGVSTRDTARANAAIRDAVMQGRRVSEITTTAADTSPVSDRAVREIQREAERESTARWFTTRFVVKDTERVTARREAQTELRCKKAMNEHIADCISEDQPVCVPLLVAYIAKQLVDLERWRVAYESVPDACLPILRDWLSERTHALWRIFRSQMRTKGSSPPKYNFSYHTLAVLYCSTTGITWPNSNGAWMLRPIPYLVTLVPSPKDLDKHVLNEYTRQRINKGVLTHTEKMARNYLLKSTPTGTCATTAIDDNYTARLASAIQQKDPIPIKAHS